MRKLIMALVTGIALLVQGVAYGQINAAEYFYDTDPGIGHGTPIPVTAGDSVDITTALPTTGLSTGFHNLFVRTRNTSNRWSLYVVRNFYLSTPSSASTSQIAAAEYFIDVDPGIGHGTPLATGALADSVDITTSVPTTGLSVGFHNLFIRVRNTNNLWSLYVPRNFYVSGPPAPSSSSQIVAAEYFIDADPGLGNGTPIPTGAAADSVDITTSIPTTGLAVGFHNLFIRTRNADNRWSLYVPRNFYVSGPPVVSTPKIVAAEYFIDADPGIGNGTPVSTGAIADSVDITTSISTSGLSTGFHNLFIRAKNAAGLWSLYAPRNFFVSPPAVVADLKIVAAEYFIDTDPGVGNGTAISPSFAVADSIDITRAVSSAGLTVGPHRLYIRTKNQGGLWSHAVSDSFNLCPLPSPGTISGLGAVCVGASITLTDTVSSGTWSSVNGHTSVTTTGLVSGVTAGVDTIRYGVSNTCGTAFAEKVVTVNPIPGPITTVTVACTGATTTLTNSLSGGTWISSNPTIASVVAATGVLTGGTTSGTAIITYTMPTGCSATGVVTVFASPALIGGASSVCVGSAIILTNATPGGTWSSSTTSVATIGSTSGALSGLAVGTTTVSYTLLSGCMRTTIITINPVPAPIAGSLGLCAGASTTLTNATGGGAWTSGNLAVATIGSGTGILTGASSGTAVITYALPTGCNATAVVTVAVTPAPIGGVLSVCEGNTTALTNTTPGGVWSSGNTAVGSIGSTTGILSGISAGTTLVSYSISGCMRTAIVTVNTTPAPIGGSLGLCAGASTTLTNTTGGGTWTSGNTAVASIGSGTGILTGASAGTAVITYALPTGCNATAVVTVAVTPAPIGGVLSVCEGNTTALTNTTPGGLWSSGTTSVGSIGSTTGILSGVSAGTTLVSYSISGCMRTAIVTVNTTPAPIGGSLGLCAGATTTLTNTTGGGAWTSGNTAVASIGSGTGILTGGSAGTAIITYALPTGCNATAVVTVAVTPAPIGGVLSVCEGNTTALTNTTLGGLWSSGTTSVGSIGSTTGILSGISAGTSIVSYSISGCTRTAIVTVNTSPAAIGGSFALCAGSTTTLTNTTTGGTWTSGVPAIASISTSGVASGITAGTATISYTISSGCSKTVIVTVNPLPTVISGASSVCEGSTTPLISGPAGGAWTSSNSATASVGNTSGIVSGVVAGTVTITYTLNTGCFRTAALTVDPSPAPITGASSVCVGSSTTLNSTTSGGSWSSSSTAIATVSASGVFSGVGAGTAVISYTSGGCSAIKAVTVNALPSAISGIPNVCVGSSRTLSSGPAGGTWTSSSPTIAGIGASSGIVDGILVGTTLITYQLLTGCQQSITLTVNPLPAAITGTAVVCVGSTTSLSNATTGGAWSSSSIATATVGSSSGVVTGMSVGTATISYTLTTGCSATSVVTVNGVPSTIVGTLNVCVGATTVLSNSITGGTWSSGSTSIATIGATTGIVTGVSAGTTQILYQLPTGCAQTVIFTVNPLPAPISGIAEVCAASTTSLSSTTTGGAWSSSNIATATVGSISGVVSGVAAGTSTISYTLGTGCYVTSVITVDALPAAITGPSTVCAGSTVALSNTTPGGTWSSSLASVATIGATTGIVTGVSAGTTQIMYQLPTGCAQTMNFTVNPLPAAISGTGEVCVGSTTALSSTTSGGAWSSSSTTTATVGAASGVVTGMTAGTAAISYMLTTGCYATSIVTVDAMPAAITGPSAVCTGSSIALFNATSGGTWSSGSTSVATIGASTGIVNGVSAGTTQISYQLSTGCQQVITFMVNPLPAAISGTADVCVGGTTALASTSSGGTWSSSNTATATVGAITGVVAGVSSGAASVTYMLSTGCYTTAVVTVHATPAPVTGPSSVCTGSTVTLSNATSGGAWSSDATSIAAIDATTGIVNGISAGTAQISYQLSTGCQQTVTFTVNPLPAAISGTAEVCVGGTTSLSSAPTGGAWSSSSSSTAMVDVSSGVVTGVATGTVTISYTLATGCNITLDVTVHAAPAAITGSSTVCAGATVTLSSTTSGGTWSSSATSIATIGATTGVLSGVAPGTTLVSYTLAMGCAATLVVSVNALPSAGTISGADTVCMQESAPLSNSTGGGTWSSSDPSVATVSGEGMVTGVGAGSATISYTVANTCGASAAMHPLIVKSIADCATGVKNPGANIGVFRLYPNPASGAFSVETSIAGTMSISGIDGKEIGTYTLKAAVNSLTLPKETASGVYMCRFTGNDGSVQVIRLVYEP